MLGTAFPSARYLPPHDNPLLLLGDLVDTLAQSDITFGNLEGSFLDNGEPAKRCRDTTICYLFRMPERYAGALATSGFDFLSLANNHFGDFGYPSRRRTMKLLDSLGIKIWRTSRISVFIPVQGQPSLRFLCFCTQCRYSQHNRNGRG